MARTHYSLDSENDVAWCGLGVLQGGETDIYKVTCITCLSAVSEAGRQAESQMHRVIKRIAVAELWWTAWVLMWGNIAAHEAYTSLTNSKLTNWMVK